MTKPKVLFLDDMMDRHTTFCRVTSHIDMDLRNVYSAEAAIALLETEKFDQVFLDHDLSEDDIMCDVGQTTLNPTGMVVVDHISKMENPPPEIFVHSCNEPAAIEMTKRLEAAHPQVVVRRLAFPWLVNFIEATSTKIQPKSLISDV